MSISYSPKNKPWDLIIVGGGPIGLSAAKVASQYDLDIIILEKGSTCGAEVRAETISPDPIITQIWGSDFLDSSLVISSQSKILMHSPGDTRQNESIMIETPQSFHWQDFINKMVKIVTTNKNVFISLNTNVIKAVLPVKAGDPVESIETDKGIVYGKTILDCSGCKTVIGRQEGININYDLIIDPIIKARYSNYPYNEDNRFHFYFIAAGSIRPQSPPCVLVMFPNAKGEVEVACQFFSDFGPKGRRLPCDTKYSDDFLVNLYNDIKTKAPGVSKKMEGLVTQIEYLTGMPAKKIVHKSMFLPGLVFCGDAGGFMDPNTNSGMITGMKSAKYWAEAGKNAVVDRFRWNDRLMNQYNDALRELPFYKDLRSRHLKIYNAKSIVYGLWRTADMLNMNWKFVMDLYSSDNKFDAMKVTDEEYKQMGWDEQVALINAILSGTVVLQIAELKVLNFLKISKGMFSGDDWSLLTSEILYDKLFNKFQGDADLNTLFSILGPESKVEYALERNSKYMIVKYVDDSAIRIATINQCGDLLAVILNQRPLFLPAEKKVLEICKICKEVKTPEQFNGMVSELGGKDAITKYVYNKKVKNELNSLLG